MSTTIKERPIIFNGEMVKAILDGRKTMTRRIAKPLRKNPPSLLSGEWSDSYVLDKGNHEWLMKDCPFGKVGDRLWVRETFAVYGDKDDEHCVIHYRANNPEHFSRKGMGFKPSIHMPRWASRITLEITSIRIERLQDISEDDAKAEGVNGGCIVCGELAENCKCATPSPDFKDSFIHLWRSIYGEESWSANPWVWVVEFKQVTA